MAEEIKLSGGLIILEKDQGKSKVDKDRAVSRLIDSGFWDRVTNGAHIEEALSKL